MKTQKMDGSGLRTDGSFGSGNPPEPKSPVGESPRAQSGQPAVRPDAYETKTVASFAAGQPGRPVVASPTTAKLSFNETAGDYRLHLPAPARNSIGRGIAAGQTLSALNGDRREGVLYKVGYPTLPAIRFFVQAESVDAIHVIVGSEESLGAMPNLTLCAPPRPKDGPVPELVRAEINGQYPLVRFAIEPAGSVNGQKTFLVSLYPAAVGARGKVSYVRDFDLKVDPPAAVCALAAPAVGKKTFAFVVGKQFKDAPSLAAYRELKKEAGFNVETIVVGEGANTPDDIRNWLKKLKKDPSLDLQFALLIGDYEDVPAQKAKFEHGVTDHYYRAIDTDSYEEDINGPDIGVGRISVSSLEQLDTVLAKETRYVKGDFASKDWQSRIAFLTTDDRLELAEATQKYLQDTYTRRNGFTGTFPLPVTNGGDQLYAVSNRASEDDVKNALDGGRAMITYDGHGAYTYWATPRVTQDDIRQMSNPDALPIVISHACITGDFSQPESFGETWLRAPHGAALFWGSVDSTFWDEDDVLERRAYDKIFGGEQPTFSQVAEHALRELWRQYGGQGESSYYWETYNILGDPSLPLRLEGKKDTTPPATPTDLTATATSSTTVALTFTASGDDGTAGQASGYDLRISTKPIVAKDPGPGEVSFDQATRLYVTPPKPSGQKEQIEVPVEPSDQAQKIYFALKVLDKVDNASELVTTSATVPARKTVFSDNFDNDSGMWEAQAPWGRVEVEGRGQVMTDSPGGNYAGNADTALTSKPISLVSLESATLEFDAKHELEASYDFVRVEVCEDKPEGLPQWQQLAYFTGEADWHGCKVDLTPYVGKSVRLRFRLTSDFNVNKDGFYLDNLKIRGG